MKRGSAMVRGGSRNFPRRQTRVLTWPLVTVWGFIAQPLAPHFFKTQCHPSRCRGLWLRFPIPIQTALGRFIAACSISPGRFARDNRDLRPADMLDLQSFIWVQGSDEYPD